MQTQCSVCRSITQHPRSAAALISEQPSKHAWQSSLKRGEQKLVDSCSWRLLPWRTVALEGHGSGLAVSRPPRKSSIVNDKLQSEPRSSGCISVLIPARAAQNFCPLPQRCSATKRAAQSRCAPCRSAEEDGRLAEFDSAVRSAAGGEQRELDEDEDLRIDEANTSLAPNNQCPISGKPVRHPKNRRKPISESRCEISSLPATRPATVAGLLYHACQGAGVRYAARVSGTRT